MSPKLDCNILMSIIGIIASCVSMITVLKKWVTKTCKYVENKKEKSDIENQGTIVTCLHGSKKKKIATCSRAHKFFCSIFLKKYNI